MAGYSMVLLSLGLFVASTAAVAMTPVQTEVEPAADTSRWHCSLCPYREGWYGTVDFGAGHLSDTSLKYADYRGLDERGAFPLAGAEVHYRDSSEHYLDFFARDLGIDNQSLEMRTGVRGRYQVRLAYREIPKYRGYGTETIYSGTGSDSLMLPTGWQSSFTTRGMTALEGSLVPSSLQTLRRTLKAGLTMKFTSKWGFAADFQHESKDGTRPFGAGLYLQNTSQFPVPVDFTTNRFDMGLERSGERGQLRLGFAGSMFDNGVSSVTWENPFSSPPASHLLRAALEPDNRAFQFSMQGALALRPRLRLSGRAAFGRMRQNDSLLPYSINPDFADLGQPRYPAASGIRVDTSNISARLSAGLTSKLDLFANAKVDKRDNDSPVGDYTIVITDFVSGGDRFNRPYSFKRESYDVEASYRAAPAVSVRAGSKLGRFRRTLQSVASTTERTYWGELNFNRWAEAQLRLKLETSKRDASPYLQVDNTGLIENPLMRKFQYADRNRDRAVVELDLAAGQPWSLNLSWSRAEDEYPQSTIGLRKSDEEDFSAELGFLLNPRISLSAFGSREKISSAMSGFNADIEIPWDAFTDDRITTLGLNVGGSVNKRVSLGLDWVQSTSQGRIAVISSPDDQPFPALHSKISILGGHVSLKTSSDWVWECSVEHEHLSTSDWQLDGLGADGIANVLALGGISPRYSITAARLQLHYRF